MEIERYLKEKSRLIEERLQEYLPLATEYPCLLHEAMRYSVFSGGKRLRSILVISAAEACKGDVLKVLPTACAIELIHTYSLIHDDLPSMDNDDYRRGRKSCHKVFGEAIAILAGNALLPLAFNLIARNHKVDGMDPSRIIRVIEEISMGIGSLGMVGGQAVDLKTKDINASLLNYIHTHKTGILFRVAVRCGGILAGASEDELRSLTLYGESLGLAFQIVDDLIDLKEDRSRLDRASWPAFFGITASKEKVQELIKKAISSINGLEDRLPLELIARFIEEKCLISLIG